jgi:hypothetical protein
MEAVRTSETSVDYETTQCYVILVAVKPDISLFVYFLLLE